MGLGYYRGDYEELRLRQNGGASPTDFPGGTSGQICLADTRDLTGTTLFGQIAAYCQAAGGVALLLIRTVQSMPIGYPGIYHLHGERGLSEDMVTFDPSTGSPITPFESMWLWL